MPHCYIALGSNQADPVAQVTRALTALAALPQTRLLDHSSLYRSAPLGPQDQPAFINAVALLETELEPESLLDALQDIELQAGRVRKAERWGPRVLDLDLLLYADAAIDQPGLRVPHPHLHERAFALVPLAEIAAGEPFPGHGSVGEALRHVDAAGVEPIEGA